MDMGFATLIFTKNVNGIKGNVAIIKKFYIGKAFRKLNKDTLALRGLVSEIFSKFNIKKIIYEFI